MSNLLRFGMAIIIAAHGVGHVLFLLPLLGIADWGRPAQSWLMGGGWLAKGLGSLIWLVAIVGFTAVAIGFFNMADWWRTVAIVVAAVSTLGLILFWANPVSSPILSALIFNLVVLAALLVFHWPPVTQPTG